MGTTADVAVEEASLISLLEKAQQSLQNTRGELILDFSSVRQIDAHGLRSLEEFAQFAKEKEINVTLRRVHVEVYKALKLMGLTDQFLFIG